MSVTPFLFWKFLLKLHEQVVLTLRRKMFIIPQIIALVMTPIGIFGNGFIAAFYCMDWVNNRKLSSSDMILTCLVMSRIFLLGIVVANVFITVFAPGALCLYKIEGTLNFLWLCANTVSLWFIACLSIFYCVKIISCNQPLFLYMKQRISVMVPKLLLGSLLVSSVSSLPCIWCEYDLSICISTGNDFRNSTVTAKSLDASYFYFHFVYSAASFIPFIIFLSSSILLIGSLWRHTRNMKHNATIFWDPSTEAHVRAIKVIISCLILYIFSFAAVSIMTLPTCMTDTTWTPSISFFIVFTYLSGHSLILILINPKLKQAMVRTLCSIKCHVRKEIF